MRKIDTNRYECVAVEHSIVEEGLKKDGTPKAPSVAVTLRVVTGPQAGKDIYWYGSLHENAQEITAKTLRSMGWSCNDITQLEGLGSLKVIVQGAEEVYEGTARQRWNVWPVKTPAPRLADENKADFATKYKALGMSTPVVEVTTFNTAPDVIPESTMARNGDNSAPATTGVPF